MVLGGRVLACAAMMMLCVVEFWQFEQVEGYRFEKDEDPDAEDEDNPDALRVIEPADAVQSLLEKDIEDQRGESKKINQSNGPTEEDNPDALRVIEPADAVQSLLEKDIEDQLGENKKINQSNGQTDEAPDSGEEDNPVAERLIQPADAVQSLLERDVEDQRKESKQISQSTGSTPTTAESNGPQQTAESSDPTPPTDKSNGSTPTATVGSYGACCSRTGWRANPCKKCIGGYERHAKCLSNFHGYRCKDPCDGKDFKKHWEEANSTKPVNMMYFKNYLYNFAEENAKLVYTRCQGNRYTLERLIEKHVKNVPSAADGDRASRCTTIFEKVNADFNERVLSMRQKCDLCTSEKYDCAQTFVEDWRGYKERKYKTTRYCFGKENNQPEACHECDTNAEAYDYLDCRGCDPDLRHLYEYACGLREHAKLKVP
eukprot:TRINITY_DN3967_c0_g1_i1.p1 TRINITY_DN3967_c0_g1~~TRINITY_DN3967_c0_g1_i1.p1  ORF type:complete len:447 (+),score=70.14 TRINITY_DN3967_c0_g1_i1:53-1342(+)